MKTSIAVAAFIAGAISIGAVLPVLAQATPAPTPVASKSDRGPGAMGKMGKMDDRGPGRGGLLMLGCAPDAAERLDVTFVRIQHRLDLTADQQKLFQTFRTKALTSQTSFADACKTAMPAVNDAKPDLLAQIKSGMSIDQARLTAMTAVLPDFEAFYASLTDAQKPSSSRIRAWARALPRAAWMAAATTSAAVWVVSPHRILRMPRTPRRPDLKLRRALSRTPGGLASPHPRPSSGRLQRPELPFAIPTG